MSRILFVHNNFPAQFRFMAHALPGLGHACAAISSPTGQSVGGLPLARYKPERGTTPGVFSPALRAEADLVRGSGAAQAAVALRDRGFTPDLIIGHPGWGETTFLREVFPKARQILYAEFYYRGEGADVGFDPEFGAPDLSERMRVHAKNATAALAYAEADRLVSPTAFQASLLPELFRAKCAVIHEGVNVEEIRPSPPARVTLADGTVLDIDTPVVTFVNRRFEPMRGFHTFMRSLPRLLKGVPNARVVLIGADEPGGYGLSAGQGTTWRARLEAELGGRLDRSRIHYTGRLPLDQMHRLMRLGAAHVYLTYPFVLSWSMLEAMALGCHLVASDTAPVREVIEDGVNGRLVDFFDHDALADRLIEACTTPRADTEAMRGAARQTVLDRLDRKRVCEPAWLKLVNEVLTG